MDDNPAAMAAPQVDAVYGLTDETLDDWEETAIDWANAPANRPGGAALDPAKVVLLGKFVAEQGVQRRTLSMTAKRLAEFLNHDSNAIATLIVVRETSSSDPKSLIHGFASRYHPDFPPPTLKLVVRPRHRAKTP